MEKTIKPLYCPWCKTNREGERELKKEKDIYECSKCGASLKRVKTTTWETVDYNPEGGLKNSNVGNVIK